MKPSALAPLPASALRWRCDEACFPFATTLEVEPVTGVVGQESAVDALAFGLECTAPGQNVFVRGLTGTGRMTLVRRLLDDIHPACQPSWDRCYVHNFTQADRPRLLSLPPGRARSFRQRLLELADFVSYGLGEALGADSVKARRAALEGRTRQQIEALTGPFEKDLKAAGLALVTYQAGPLARLVVLPLVDGKPLPVEEFAELHTQGKIEPERWQAYKGDAAGFQHRLEEITRQLGDLRHRSLREVRAFMEETARSLLGEMTATLRREFDGADVAIFLDEVVRDVVETRVLGDVSDAVDPRRLYGVNILVEHEPGAGCPVVSETAPSLANLLGTVEREWSPQGGSRSDYQMVRAGALLRADGGYLILDARDVLSEPGAWKVLIRTLRSGWLEMVPPEVSWPFMQPSLKPEPVAMRLRVILLGGADIYRLLDENDADFADLFKVLADFDNVIPRGQEAALQYAGVVSRIAREEALPPFQRGAVAALVEYGARVAAHRGKLSARFARIADIAREAAFLARQRQVDEVSADDVREAVRRTKRRADLPARRFRELLGDGTIRLQTSGRVAGQVNGLAVISTGPIVYGFPARITATIGAGSAGIIDIEGQASLSGAIHTKGFHILGGLLRHLLQTDHPLAFSASLAFEQSYGGIDGDSASGAEICCLLSALTGVPLRQDLALTGAIDQLGHLMAVGGVNEKIEGFFDTCNDLGLTGEQGVIIPRSNAGDLMLRQDVVEACAGGRFHVYAVATVCEALEILTSMPTGCRESGGDYPEGTLLRLAMEQAHEYWTRTFLTPALMREELDGDEEEDAAEG